MAYVPPSSTCANAGALVNSRYDAIGRLCAELVRRKKAATGPSVSDRIDAVVTHPLWGWLALGSVMTLLFLSIFIFAEYPMNFIDEQTAALADWVKGAISYFWLMK